jgi:hypothetical protein
VKRLTTKAIIRKDPDSGFWVVTRPRLGFGGVERYAAPTHRDAVRWLTNTVGRQSTLASIAERNMAPAPGSTVRATGTDGRPWWV